MPVSDVELPLPGVAGQYVVRVVAGPVPALRLPPAYEPWLYFTPAHLALQTGAQWHFFVEEPAIGRTLAQLSVVLSADGRTARSPGQAPFGGVQAAPALPALLLTALLEVAENHVRAHGAQQLTLRLPALAYDAPAVASLTVVLHQRGYRVTLAEQNNHLPLAHDYAARLHPSERRRLRKCAEHGLRFEQEPPLLLPLAYAFLRRCRQEKGQDLSMSLEQVQALFRAVPRHAFLFSVRDAAGEWAALTIAVQVRPDVLYNFYPASPLAYNRLSPVVLLNAGLHAFGQASGMRLLDLGTSSLPDGPNHSLLQFKRHLGGVLSPKLTLTKAL